MLVVADCRAAVWLDGVMVRPRPRLPTVDVCSPREYRMPALYIKTTKNETYLW